MEPSWILRIPHPDPGSLLEQIDGHLFSGEVGAKELFAKDRDAALVKDMDYMLEPAEKQQKFECISHDRDG